MRTRRSPSRVFGYPFAFPDTEGERYKELQTLAWYRLEDAGRAAGFEEVERLPEPRRPPSSRRLRKAQC